MRQFPDENDPDDVKEVERLKAKPWMYETLKLNPKYVHWGPGEDYMKGETKEGGWNSAIVQPDWKSMFGAQAHPLEPSETEPGFTLDDLNEVVHFYFAIVRDSEDCERCGQSGYNPETRRLSENFYAQRQASGLSVEEISRRLMLGQAVVDALGKEVPGWSRELTDEEIEYLRTERRLFNMAPDATNDAVRVKYLHDAINQHMLVKHRATRLGFYGKCSECDGHGYVYTAPAAHLELTFWLLHPRKGASRGVTIKNIEEAELPAVYDFLKSASERNTDRFRKVVDAAVAYRRTHPL